MKRVLCIFLCILMLLVPTISTMALDQGDYSDLSEILTDYKPVNYFELARFTASFNEDFFYKLNASDYYSIPGAIMLVIDPASAEGHKEVYADPEKFGLVKDNGFVEFAWWYDDTRDSEINCLNFEDSSYGKKSYGYCVGLSFSEEGIDYLASLSEYDRMAFIMQFYMTLMSNECVTAIISPTLMYSSPTPLFSLTVMPDDANGDGFVNAKDSLTTRAFLSGVNDRIFAQNADADKDGQITARDSLLIKKAIVDSFN